MFKFYRNLNAQKTSNNKWSLYTNGSALEHAIAIYSTDVTIKQPSGKKFIECLSGGNRSVFAWFKSDNVITNKLPPLPKNAIRINFNPKKGDKFFHSNGVQVNFLKQVWLTNKGECFGIQ